MDFEPERPEHEALPQGRARLRRARDRAPRRGVGPRPHLPGRHRAARWASSGCSASRSPRSTAAAAPTSPRCASPSRSSAGSTSRWPSRSRPASGSAPTRSSRSAPRSSASAGCPTCARAAPSARFGLTEPDAGSDAGAHPHAGRARRGDRRVGHRRREGVHHQLGHADHVDRHRHRPHRRRARSARSSCPPARPGFTVAAAVPQDGLARVRHPRPDVRRLPGARRPTCSASGAGASRNFLAILDDGRIAIAALAVGLVAGVPRASRRSTPRSATPSAARSAATRPSRSSAPTWRCWPRTPACSPTRRRGCKDHGPAVQAGGGDGQALRDRGGGHRHPRGHADLRRLRLHRRDAGDAASTATPRSSRSARARARSSAS